MVSPHAVYGAMGLIARWFPVPPLESVSSLTLDELKQHYRRRDMAMNFVGVGAIIAVAVGIYFVLVQVADKTLSDLAGAPYRIDFTKVEIGLCAGFLSFVTAGSLVMLGCRLWWGNEEFTRYITYCGHRGPPGARYNLERVFQGFLLLIGLPLALITLLAIDWYTVFTPTAIVESPFWSYGKRIEHPYAAVRRVCEIQANHGLVQDTVGPYQIIDFTDGTRWQSPRGKGGGILEYQREIIKYVADRRGIAIEQYDFIDDVPP